MKDDSLKEIQATFLVESDEFLVQAEELLVALSKPNVNFGSTFNQLKRIYHNVKGSSKALGYERLSNFIHNIENFIVALTHQSIALTPDLIQLLLDCNDALRADLTILIMNGDTELDHSELLESLRTAIGIPTQTPSQDSHEATQRTENASSIKAEPTLQEQTPPHLDESIRVPMRKIDDILDAFGEQMIHLSALDHYLENRELNADQVALTLDHLKKLAFDLQRTTMTLRMINFRSLFSRLERVIRDTAITTNKSVQTEVIGAENELDKMIIEQLTDPLIHMVRNSVDHGLESREDRINAGKPAVGKITLAARREGGNIAIEISDDGRGMDPNQIRRKAIENGIIHETQAKALSEEDILNLIFENGFSTKDTPSEISGRGIGMNVVKEMITNLKGSCEISTHLGQGTSFQILVPLSLSIFNGMVVVIHHKRYIIPCSQVSEIVEVSSVQSRELDQEIRVIQLRDSILKILDLRKMMGDQTASKNIQNQNRPIILVTPFNQNKNGFLIDQILNIQRIVQKPISPGIACCPGAAGVTILGDGSPAIILDLKLLQNQYSKNLNPENRNHV